MQRKIHNQTIFVAALSVYLGLLIAGAPPQILAQNIAQISNKSSGCNLIELQNKAAKKFSELDLESANFVTLPAATRILLTDDYRIAGNFDEFDVQLTLLNKKEGLDPGFSLYVEKLQFKESYVFVEDFLRYVGALTDSLRHSGCRQNKTNCFPFKLKIRLDKSEFFAGVEYKHKSNQDAQIFGEAYRYLIDTYVCQFKDTSLLKYRFDSTQVSVKNSQVFIATRLPRAGLDALLKANEKAN